MFDHILNDQVPEFERFDFAVTEIKVDGKVVWHRKHGLAEELNMEGE